VNVKQPDEAGVSSPADAGVAVSAIRGWFRSSVHRRSKGNRVIGEAAYPK
jgi:hypothetical protein